jgi:predicted RNase H-like HicB family nuclease
MVWQGSPRRRNPLWRKYPTKRQARQQRRKKMVGNIKYELILYWSKQDQAFIAEAPELPGCAADGATYQEAVANIEVVIQEWIETAKELGRPIPEPRGRLLYA